MAGGISPGGRPIDDSPLSASHDDNWVAKRGGLPPYVRGIARGIAKKHGGKVTSNDIQMAIGVLKNWASGRGKVHPAVKAAAAAAIAQWEAMKGTNLSTESNDDLDLAWASFDAARGTKPRQPAAAPPPATGNIAGYTGPAQSASTINAIKAYQKANGLPQTGNLDARTLNMANGTTAAGKAAGKKAAAAGKKGAAKAGAAKKKAATAAKTAANKKIAAKKKAASAATSAAKKNAAASKRVQSAKVAAAKKAAAPKSAAAKSAAKTSSGGQPMSNAAKQKAAATFVAQGLKSKGRQ